VTFVVTDSGIGIAPKDHELIFQEFSQVENALQQKYKGTGLGLPLSKRLAELLNGRVSLESELGKGSSFAVTVPRIYKAPAGHEDALVAERLEPHRMTIVALDDNPADLAALQTMLRGSDYQLIPTQTVSDAKRAAVSYQPRAIVLDVVIGDDFSWRLLTEIRQAPELAGVPIIVVSTHEDAAKAMSLGANEFASKPIEREWLIDTLDRLIKGEVRRRVLVIDDDEVFRYVVRQQLAGDNVRVLEAATGLQGLQRAMQERFDLLLLDLNLPDITGFEVLSKLEDTQEIPPVVIVSGMALGAQDRRRLRKAAAIVPKSEFKPGQLMDVMDLHRGRTVSGAPM
jgi:CheY-like chemotaxis protein